MLTIKKFHFFENMEVIISLVGALLVLVYILKSKLFYFKKAPRHLIFALFIIKIAGASLLFQHYDNLDDRRFSDIFKHYDDGLTIKNGILNNPAVGGKLLLQHKSNNESFTEITENCRYWNSGKTIDNFQGNRFMIRLNAILSLITQQNYFLHLVFFTLISFCGMLMLVKCLPESFEQMQIPLLAALTISPSLLFWTSGILKESLTVFLLGLFCINAFRSKHIRSQLLRYFIIALSISILFVIRPYILLALILGLIIFQLHKYLNTSWLRLSMASILSLFVILIILLQFSRFNPLNEITNKRVEFEELAKTFDAGSTYSIPVVNEPIEIIYKAPQAILNVLFRPHVFEIENKSYLPFALEGAVLLIISFLIIPFFKRPENNLQSIIVPGMMFILVVCLIIGLTIPILGASVRYRSPAIMVYIIILFSLIDWKKIKSLSDLKTSK